MSAILMEVYFFTAILTKLSSCCAIEKLCTSADGYSYFTWDSQQGVIYFTLSGQYYFLSHTCIHTSATSATKLVMKRAHMECVFMTMEDTI